MGGEYSTVAQDQEKKARRYYERLKLWLLTTSFFCVISSYTIAKELKDSVFAFIVGPEYIPWAKFMTMVALVPAIFLYSKVVDRVRRYQLLCLYSVIFGVLGLLFAYLLGHGTIGLPNTNTAATRIFGWIFYFFIEGYSPFVVSVFWAFANSVSSPEGAKKNYGFLVAGSKLGGAMAAGFAWLWLSSRIIESVVLDHQLLLAVSSLFLLLVPVLTVLLMRKVPGYLLHGYEAAYQHEKARSKKGENGTGVFAGIKMLIKNPYVLGIFGMIYFYEVVAAVLSYLRVGVAMTGARDISAVSAYLFYMIFLTHFIGFFIALFVTGTLFSRLGERLCLLIIPISSGIALFYFIINGATSGALTAAFVVLKSINYAFSYPVRESLYIPTVKEIKFKSKSWIDAFGTKFAKSSGNTFNIFARHVGSATLTVHAIFFAGIIGLWVVTAYLLGLRFDRAVAKNEVIGGQPDIEEEE